VKIIKDPKTAWSIQISCGRCSALVTLAAWKKLPPFRQGYALYAQGSWLTSEIAGQTNPHTEGTTEWAAFQEGQRRATLDAQDGEE
jgi:hypothetical protein